LPALADKSKIEKFVAAIPGETIIELLTIPLELGEFTFLEHLSALLRSCAPGTTGLDEGRRRDRLFVCLNAVHHIARTSIVPSGVFLPPSLLNDVRTNFTNIGLMRALWIDTNPAIRVTSRSICALLARQLLRKRPLEESELAWLQDVMGKASNTIYNQLNNLGVMDNMNVDSFVYGVLSHQTEVLPITQAISFTETLTILMNLGSQASLPRDRAERQLSSLVHRIEQGNHEDRDNVLDKLRRLFQGPQVLDT
jgi:hypothetical protein